MNSEFFKNFHQSAKPLTLLKMVMKSTYFLNAMCKYVKIGVNQNRYSCSKTNFGHKVKTDAFLSGITNFRRISMTSCLLTNFNFSCRQKPINSGFFKNFHQSVKPLTSLKMVINSTYL